jgi:hypothetical protein
MHPIEAKFNAIREAARGFTNFEGAFHVAVRRENAVEAVEFFTILEEQFAALKAAVEELK